MGGAPEGAARADQEFPRVRQDNGRGRCPVRYQPRPGMADSQGLQVNCARCGKAFPVPSPQHSNKLFCSRVCKDLAYRAKLKGLAARPVIKTVCSIRIPEQKEPFRWL